MRVGELIYILKGMNREANVKVAVDYRDGDVINVEEKDGEVVIIG